MELLEIVNESGEVVGTEDRAVIHRDGLLHREAHIWFYTPDGKVILQHRAKDKDTWPDLLDVAVGGHVEIDDSFLETAIKEIQEESGLHVTDNDLEEIAVHRSCYVDLATDTKNNILNAHYLYRFNGDVSDLQVEEGKSLGFKTFEVEDLMYQSQRNPELFTNHISGNFGFQTMRKIRSMID